MAGNHAQGGGLATARWTKDTAVGAGLDAERYAVDSQRSPEHLADSDEFERSAAHALANPACKALRQQISHWIPTPKSTSWAFLQRFANYVGLALGRRAK